MRRSFLRPVQLWLLSVPFLMAGAVPVTAAAQEDPYQIVRESAEEVLETVDRQKALNGNRVTDEMVDALLDVLEPVVDFPAIAHAVMGKHATGASDAQVNRFLQAFRDALVSLYMESFLTFEVAEVTVLDPPADFDPASGRATVRMLATGTDGSKYAISYSMRANGNGEWKVRNVIVEGINLGLTFLNQFDGAMARHSNDIDAVINNWSTEMTPP